MSLRAPSVRATRNIGLILLGVVFLVAGMVLYAYHVTVGSGSGAFFISYVSYPYQTLGLILLGIGIAVIGLGVFTFEKERLHKIFHLSASSRISRNLECE